MSITRRHLLLTTAALGAGAVVAPSLADWAEDIAARLTRDLAARVTTASTRLKVLRVTPQTALGLTYLDAVVEMHWPPGTRRRPVQGVGADGQAAYEVLLARSIDTFRKPNPAAFA